MTNKTTYVGAIEIALSLLEGEDAMVVRHDDDLGTSYDITLGDVREKLAALRDSVAKRNATKADKPTKAQRENAELSAAIADAMEVGKTYSIKDICGLVDALHEASSQKVAPLMAALIESGKVVKSVVKGKNFYTLA